MNMLDKGTAQANGISELSPLAGRSDHAARAGGPVRKERGASEPTPLAIFVRKRLGELDLKQSDFCRQTGFDQGLLSKIQNSITSSLSLESTLRLALGLSVSPKVIFGLTSRPDMQELVLSAYSLDFFPELSEMGGLRIPTPVFEITTMALFAYSLGRSLAPAVEVLSHLSAVRRGARDRHFEIPAEDIQT